jgi:hypothetical protein
MAYATINDPSAQFQTLIWTGTGNDNTAVTNTGNSNLQPDFAWVKARNATHDHILFNSTQGNNYNLRLPTTDPLYTNSNYLKSFDSDGLTLGTSNRVNGSGEPYVGWQWKATAGTTATNNAGSISSTVQANATAGFSIVKWTSDGNNGRTVGHGLGAKPTVIITKNSSAAGSWYTFVEAAGVDKYLRLNSADAVTTNTDIFGGGAQATAVFTIGQSSAGYSNGNDIVAYVFAPIKGYSKFGGYSGNGEANGPFVYTGFKPAFLMRKCINEGLDWVITDSTRDPVNVGDESLYANLTYVEYSGSETKYDLLSNGFKMRGNWTSTNKSGNTYIYMAFAENPFVATNGIPTTAR